MQVSSQAAVSDHSKHPAGGDAAGDDAITGGGASRRPPKILITASAVGVVLVLILAAVVTRGGGSGPVRDGERAIANAEEVLGSAERTMHEQVTLADATIADGAGCWFS